MHWVGAGFWPGSFFQFFNLFIMKTSKIKSFVFGLAFLGSMGFGGITANAQGMGGPGNGEGERWVCCQLENEFCEDWLGGAWSDSTKVAARFCP
jgi:hypothetical protein